MAFTKKEISQSYLEDITRWCPQEKVRGVWRNSVRKSGKITDEMRAILYNKGRKGE